MTIFPSHARRWAAIACMLFLITACGGDDDATPAGGAADAEVDAAPDDNDLSAAGTDDSDSDDRDSGDAASSGSVTVGGATYEFTDVIECEVGGDWGPEWRSFVAFDESGHNHVHITHAAAPDDWMTSFDLSVGLANARTLDGGNPDQEWTTGMGGSVAATLTDAGAEGTAEVTNLDAAEGAVDATATWSFSC